ncbi:MAG: NAD(P)/FAD-dependent oxidoreductase [Candidatus Omnitrophica bacterium]|nr:NAD(P)/FAD-dependent oxidoreductase [Candidatus Omnitrophota bacterium]
MKNKYDAIIIGAGISGLICGTYLAKNGLKVLMLEKNKNAGGCCASFYRKGIKFDAGAHIIGECGKGGMLRTILTYLGVNQKFYQPKFTDRIFFPEDIVEIPNDLAGYAALLQQKFKKERNNISRFFNKFISCSNIANIALIQKNYSGITYQELLNKYFISNRLKAILSAQSGYLGVAPNKVNAAAMCAMLSSYLAKGAYYPVGGSQSFADNIMKRFIYYGGELKLASRVSRILLSNGAAEGVAVNEKEIFKTNKIVSSIDLHTTLFELLKNEKIKSQVKTRLTLSKETPSLFVLYLGVAADTKLIERSVGWHYAHYEINKFEFDDCVYITAPTLYDSSLSPKGIHAVQLFIKSRYDFNSMRNWHAAKDIFIKEALLKLDMLIPGVKEKITVIESASPETIRRFTNNKNGAAYGWMLTTGQYERNKIIAQNVNDGLFLTGHWTNPGGGIVAVGISGCAAAKKILKSL